MTADDYISLMPVKYITIQADGITLEYRRYDSVLLHPYRLLKSSDAAHDGKWAVHYDPYNPGAVWVMDPFTELWIECSWMNGDAFAKPFSRHIRTEAKRILEGMGMTGDSSMLRLTQDVLASTKAARTQMDDEAERNKVAELRNELGGMPSPVLTPKAVTAIRNTDVVGDEVDDSDEQDFEILGTIGNKGVAK